MLQVIHDNPEISFAIFCAVTGGAGLLVKKLDASPRGQGVLKILSALGIDIPRFGEGLAQLFGGKPPGST